MFIFKGIHNFIPCKWDIHRFQWFCLKKKTTFYLSIFRERWREREREGDKHLSVASCMCPEQGLNPQSRHVPWQGIKLGTFRFAGWHPTNWTTLFRAQWFHFWTETVPAQFVITAYLISLLLIPLYFLMTDPWASSGPCLPLRKKQISWWWVTVV